MKRSESRIKTSFAKATKFVHEKFTQLSSREKGIIFITISAVALLIVVNVVDNITSAFDEQTIALESAKTNLENVSVLLQNYRKLVKRREEIEARYKEVEFKEGALSYLDSLIKESLGIQSGEFKITDSQPQPFGLNFEQTSYEIRLDRVTDLKKFISLMLDLVSGKHPMLMSRLEINKSYSGDKLTVKVDVNKIQRAGQKT